MTTFTLEPQYLYKLYSMPRGFATKTAVSNQCNVPKHTVKIDFLGNCLLCDCDGWLPLPVGKVEDFNSIDELLDCAPARLIQDDVAAGNFSWCAIDHCGIRNNNKIKNELDLSINIDESCNLHCPSCRRDPIMITHGPEYDQKIKRVERILQWLERYNKKIHIITSGNGDPLASTIMRPLIKNLVPNALQEFTLFTNGLLIKKQLHDLAILNQIRRFRISVDAGSSSVYEDVRRPGRWSVLMDNFDYLREIGKQSITTLNFALQNKNYKDLPNFVDLCNQYEFIGMIHQLDDWGTWSQIDSERKDSWTIKNGIFQDHDVLDRKHPNHLKAVRLIQQYLDHPRLRFSPNILAKI